MRYDTDTDTDRAKLDEALPPDVILPAQFHHDVRALGDPERRLRLAVLEDAIDYFQRYLDVPGRRARALHEDAVDWFSSQDRSEPFSFENVCEALGLDPDWIRQGLCRWCASERARRAARFALGRSTSAIDMRTRRAGGGHLRAA